MTWIDKIKNVLIANDGCYTTIELQKVLYNHRGVPGNLYFRKFYMVGVLSPLFLLHYLMCNALLFCLYFFLDIVFHIIFVFQEFLLYDSIAILILSFLIAAYYFYDILFFRHDDISDFADIALIDILPSIFYNKGWASYEVLSCILGKFSYGNNSTDLLIMQGDI